MSIFEKRLNLKPYEYPSLLEFRDAIRHSYWLHTEFNFTGDVQDWFGKTNSVERTVLKRSMLAISQIEVAVKTFWARIFDRLPKPEIAEVGMTFAESEVRHSNAYSALLDLLRLNKEFENLSSIPVLMKRYEYLAKIQEGLKSMKVEDFIKTLILFSAFVEHISLFSQFLIMMSFNKYKSMFKGISNVIEATSKEEQIHGLFGQALVGILRQEAPNIFTAEFEEEVSQFAFQAFSNELELLEWLYDGSDLPFLPKNKVALFLQYRFDSSLMGCGFKKIFNTPKELISDLSWFENELYVKKENDFFNKRSVDYAKKIHTFSEHSLF